MWIRLIRAFHNYDWETVSREAATLIEGLDGDEAPPTISTHANAQDAEALWHFVRHTCMVYKVWANLTLLCFQFSSTLAPHDEDRFK